MIKIESKSILHRVEFWIVLFFLIRLVGITQPPLEIGHNWRQVTGLMVARNFLEIDPNILYPRVDETQGGTGIIGMEFPSLNYVHFLFSKFFGYEHWYGRLINLIVSSLGILYFFKIIRRFFNHKHALASSVILMGSIWFAFSRKMMPDTYCISLMFIGIYYGITYLDKAKVGHLLLYVFFTSLAVLSKIPAIIYFVLLVPLWWNTKQMNAKTYFAIATVIPIVFIGWWYFIWNPYLSAAFGNWYNIGKPLSEGVGEIVSNITLVLKRFYFNAFSSYFFFVLFLVGLFLFIYQRKRRLIVPVTMLTIVFVLYIFKSGYFFFHHSYYIIPFVPVMAFVAGYAVSLVKTKVIFVPILVIGVAESIANQQHDFFIKETEKYKLSLASIADKVSKKDDLIAISGNGNPQELYLTNRKGWVYNEDQLNNEAFVQEISEKGCAFIFVNRQKTSTELNEILVFENEFYKVYAINKKEATSMEAASFFNHLFQDYFLSLSSSTSSKSTSVTSSSELDSAS